MPFLYDVAIVGGCGHVGLPLAIAFAQTGAKVAVIDVDEAAVKLVNDATLPFAEDGAQPLLQRAIDDDRLHATTDPAIVAEAETIIVVIGTPVDEHLNPDPRSIVRALSGCSVHFRDGQQLVLRSTVYPGVTAQVERLVRDLGVQMDVSFCPERIAEGRAMTELVTLPQIVGARTEQARRRAGALFGRLTSTIVDLDPEEAELAKLFTNTWRYITFAAANQFFMTAHDRGLDFEKIRQAVIQNYPRAADLPGAGFAAGPCLLKDTMQLAAFNNNNFALGHSAMQVNEGLPLYLVTGLQSRYDLSQMTVGILGMAFKAGSDDTRSSLSYKLKRILEFTAERVLCTDPHVTTDPSLVPLEQVLAEADLLVLGTPHAEYAGLEPAVPVTDVWGLLGPAMPR